MQEGRKGGREEVKKGQTIIIWQTHDPANLQMSMQLPSEHNAGAEEWGGKGKGREGRGPLHPAARSHGIHPRIQR